VRTANRNNLSKGFTLLELLIVLAITGVLAAAITYAFAAEVDVQRATQTRLANLDKTNQMEQTLTNLIQGAMLSSTLSATTTNPITYFQGVSDTGTAPQGCSRITFTTTAPGVPIAAIDDTTNDFETQQTMRGPIGGLSEVSLGTAPVGNAGDLTGLFERVQHPSDADPTQGGVEFDIDPDIASMGFQFWDGEEWDDSWDTTTETLKLPEAVQVSYTLKSDPNSTLHIFVVPIASSTVNAQNPAPPSTQTGTGGSTQ